MDGVVPVVIMIGVYSVPTAIVRLERVMRPANAGIGTGYNNSLPGKSQRPHLRCVCVTNARFDRVRLLEVQRRLNRRAWLRKLVLNVRIPFHPRDVGTRGERLG